MTARLLLFCLVTLLAAPAALALDCQREAREELQRIGVADEEVAELHFVEKLNPTDRGPDVLGVRAWLRLRACGDEGYLVIDMTRSCFVRQSYTRGNCRRPGVTAY